MSIVTSTAIAGRVIKLSANTISFADVLESLSKTEDNPITLILHDDQRVSGVAVYSDADGVFYAFLDERVSATAGICIEFGMACDSTSAPDGVSGTKGCASTAATIVDTTRIPVLDSEGCPTDEYTTVGNLREALFKDICALFESEGQSTLVASDSIVAVGSNCKLKRIAPDALCCQ